MKRFAFAVPSAAADAMYWHEIDTPLGALLLAGDGERLRLIHFQAGPRPLLPERAWKAEAAPFRLAMAQLEEYFAGTRREFDLPLAADGTPFQCKVWQTLSGIAYGSTISYAELARRVGRSVRASRAVGLANGANPLPIVVPCHRVIGSDGSLTGFGGGLELKRQLLALEGAACVQGMTRELFDVAAGHHARR